MNFFAQTVVEIPISDTIKTLIGLLGVLTALWVVLSVAYTSRKLFGKHPPLHEEIANVRKEFKAGDERLERRIEDVRAENNSLSQEIMEKFDDLRRERSRSEEEIHRKLNGISRNLYLIAGKVGAKTLPNTDEELP